ncbi:MAG: hypothetical protein ACKVQK_06590 [Burkholderiales bacterium]
MATPLHLTAVNIPVDSPEMERAVQRAATKFVSLYREQRAIKARHLIDRATAFYLELMPITVEDDPQVERNGRARARFLREDRPYTAAQASKCLGSQARNATELASRLKREGRLFTVRDGTKDKFPRFQFGAHGEALPAIAQVLTRFKDKLEGWEIALWFHSNNAWLPEQRRPVDLLRKRPEAVLAAAEREVAGAEF